MYTLEVGNSHKMEKNRITGALHRAKCIFDFNNEIKTTEKCFLMLDPLSALTCTCNFLNSEQFPE